MSSLETFKKNDYWELHVWPEFHPLSALMSDISERNWCASWLSGTEYTLWDTIQEGHSPWEVTDSEIDELRSLSQQYGCWIWWVEEIGALPVELKIWEQHIKERKGLNHVSGN